MIDIKRKEDCCGCEACVQRCPKNCISLYRDNEGFLYPKVEVSLCIDCHLCERVCPVLNPGMSVTPLKTLGAVNGDLSVREQSSSGGVFTALATATIKNGGVVFGAQFNHDWTVVHDYTDNTDGISAFRGSKYVQSHIGDSFIKAERFLKEGRAVLFSGTPCQIRALKLFLRKDYPNLLAVDIVCHGVPSPGVFAQYLTTLDNPAAITSINFRDKTFGWANYSFAWKTEKKVSVTPHLKDLFGKAFGSDIINRPSCYECTSRNATSGADITLADYWGVKSYCQRDHNEYGEIQSLFTDDRGVNVVIVKSEKGLRVVDSLDLITIPADYSQIIRSNISIVKSPVVPKNRSRFMKGQDFSSVSKVQPDLARRIRRYAKRPIKPRIVRFVKIFVVKTVGLNNVKRIKRLLKR